MKAFRYGDNINTDVIIPARHLNLTSPSELAAHCLEDLDRTFIQRVQPGDCLVAGANFGCGSSREHAPIALKAAGLSCVIAASFARIFYRNSINIGFPILECPPAADEIRDGDEIAVDFAEGIIRDLTTRREYHAAPFPPFLQEIIRQGGLLNYLRGKP